MNRPPSFWGLLTIFTLLFAGGCKLGNQPLNAGDVRLENRRFNDTRSALFLQKPPVDSDGYFVGLSLSGGGSRAANFGAACMFQLERLGLLQRVDYISSVSGGSIPAAYYCLNDKDWNPSTVQAKMTHAFASDLIRDALLVPWNAAGLLFTDLSRSDLLAADFNSVMYNDHGRYQTFADLRADRPRLLINSTDLQSGRRFLFTNESFNQLNSDLSKYSVGYAVAASSAVPLVLHPIPLRDFSTRFPEYRHMVDGGIADNLGVVSLVETYLNQVTLAQQEHLPDPYPHGAVFFVIDARTRFNGKLSDIGEIKWTDLIRTAFRLTSNSLVNRISSATMSDLILRNAPDSTTARQLRDDIDKLQTTGYLQMDDRTGHHVTVVYLALSQVDQLRELPFDSFNQSINGISTYFNIQRSEAYQLYEAADLLVKEKLETQLREIAFKLNPAAQTQPARSPTTRASP